MAVGAYFFLFVVARDAVDTADRGQYAVWRMRRRAHRDFDADVIAVNKMAAGCSRVLARGENDSVCVVDAAFSAGYGMAHRRMISDQDALKQLSPSSKN